MNEPSKIPAPFASSGLKNDIPLTTDERGLASWSVGFPAETSIPVTEGGVAPHRADFNGILNAMSEAIRWGQEGNMWSYDNAVEYKVDAVVLYNNELYLCKTACQNVLPTNAEYWTKLTANGKVNPDALTGTAPISITGTADTAVKDGDGDVITETYMPLAGGNFTDDVTVKGEKVITEATNNPVPVGTIIWSASATVPNGYLLCNGTAVGRTAYPDLFEAIGTTYGSGDGSTTFNLPNLNGKTMEGVTALPCIKAFSAVVGDPVIVASELAQEVASKLPLSGGTMTGDIQLGTTANVLHKSTDDSWIDVIGATANKNGGQFTAFGNLFGNQALRGSFSCEACTADGESIRLRGYRDGSLTWNQKEVERVDSAGTNYIRYVNGLQICWGENRFYLTQTPTGVHYTFPVPFVSAPAVSHNISGGNSKGIIGQFEIISSTKIDGYFWNNNTDTYNYVQYIAIGRWK